MSAPSTFKKEFLKKWVLGLQICGSSTKNMSFLERKKAIKLSADVAMAYAKDFKTCWSRALIANASKQDDNKILVRNILGSEFERLKKSSIGSKMCNKRVRSKKILKRSCTILRIRSTATRRVLASSIAKRLVKERTLVLKGLVPGGESMDEFSLLKETLDYIHSLRAQVDVMQRLAYASQLSNLQLMNTFANMKNDMRTMKFTFVTCVVGSFPTRIQARKLDQHTRGYVERSNLSGNELIIFE
ncbi:hypothetical protein HHK36_013740 [Tetracentron sinense]|uniref:IBH1-like N-terminal domain-containing protein n=1 Tax=Tetracentron sinense TaxID=13715 RepID=A0A835DH10_TETSI|nr:hypothetical protein HHK36_013740 [Tetracentron sinense]